MTQSFLLSSFGISILSLTELDKQVRYTLGHVIKSVELLNVFKMVFGEKKIKIFKMSWSHYFLTPGTPPFLKSHFMSQSYDFHLITTVGRQVYITEGLKALSAEAGNSCNKYLMQVTCRDKITVLTKTSCGFGILI